MSSIWFFQTGEKTGVNRTPLTLTLDQLLLTWVMLRVIPSHLILTMIAGQR